MIPLTKLVMAALLCVLPPPAEAAGVVIVTERPPVEAPAAAGAAALLADACSSANVFVTPWRQAFYVRERAGTVGAVTKLLGADLAIVTEWTDEAPGGRLRLTVRDASGAAAGVVEEAGPNPLEAVGQCLPKLQQLLSQKVGLTAPRWPPTGSHEAFAAWARGIAAASEATGARDAEPLLREAVKSDSQFAPAHHELGLVLWDLGRRDEAVQAYRQALAARPDSAMTRNNLGVALMRADDLGGARSELEAALGAANDPAAVAYAHVSLGNLHRQQKDFASAQREYELARQSMPQHPAPLLNLAVVALMQNDAAGAEGLLRRVTALDTDRRATADAYRLLGDQQTRQARFDQAVVEYQRALAAQPDYAFAHCNLGAAYRKLNQFAQAEECYRRAIELDNDAKATGAAHNNLGNLFKQLGKLTEAAEHFRTALKYDPDNATIRNNLREVEQGR